MSFRPAASQEAGAQFANRRAVSSLIGTLTLAVLPLAFAQLPARADEAQDLLKKMGDVYKNAKSFDGAFTVKQSGKTPNGKPFSLNTMQKIKYKAPNLFVVDMKMAGTGEAAKANGQGQTIVSDGKSIFVYNTEKKQYIKMPVPPQISFVQLLGQMRLQFIPNGPVPGAKVKGGGTSGGRTATIVEVKPDLSKLPPTATPAQKAMMSVPVQFFVDKQNFHFLKLSRASAESPTFIEVVSQTLNPSLAASLFAFKPPAGAKEMPMPQNPGMPGQPAPK